MFQNLLLTYHSQINDNEQNFADSYINMMLKKYLELQNNKFQTQEVLEQELNLLIKMNQYTNLKLSMGGNNSINNITTISNKINNTINDYSSSNIFQMSPTKVNTNINTNSFNNQTQIANNINIGNNNINNNVNNSFNINNNNYFKFN